MASGLLHHTSEVSHAAARLFVVLAKLDPAAWILLLPVEMHSKLRAQICKTLGVGKSPSGSPSGSPAASPRGVGISRGLAEWVRMPTEELDCLLHYGPLEPRLRALEALQHAIPGTKREDATVERFEEVCGLLKASMSDPRLPRQIFERAAALVKLMMQYMAPHVSALDLHMVMGRLVFPALITCAHSSESRVQMATDKLLLFFAKHPRVGAETITRNVVLAVRNSERSPLRPICVLRNLLDSFGSVICAQPSLVSLMLEVVAVHMNSDSDTRVTNAVSDLLAAIARHDRRTFETCLADVEDTAVRAMMRVAAKGSLPMDDEDADASPQAAATRRCLPPIADEHSSPSRSERNPGSRSTRRRRDMAESRISMTQPSEPRFTVGEPRRMSVTEPAAARGAQRPQSPMDASWEPPVGGSAGLLRLRRSQTSPQPGSSRSSRPSSRPLTPEGFDTLDAFLTLGGARMRTR